MDCVSLRAAVRGDDDPSPPAPFMPLSQEFPHSNMRWNEVPDMVCIS